jgi:hypothetical protein
LFDGQVFVFNEIGDVSRGELVAEICLDETDFEGEGVCGYGVPGSGFGVFCLCCWTTFAADGVDGSAHSAL